MLEGLTKPKWSKLATAHGTAEAIPELVRTLAAPDLARVRRARAELVPLVLHQESVFAASTAVVPFLVELVLAPAVLEREALVVLLAHLALGDPRAFEVSGGVAREETLVDDEDGPSTATWKKVMSATSKLAPLLADESAPVRTAAAYLLAFFPSAKKSVPALRKALAAETNEHVLASEMLALGLLQRAAGTSPDVARLEAARVDARAIVRAASATALALVVQDALAPEAVTALDAAKETEPRAEAELLWGGGDLGGLARDVRASIRIEPPGELARRLEDRIAAGDRGRDVIALALRLLERLLPLHPSTRGRRLLSDLDDPARTVLRVVAALGQTGPSTRIRGLPGSATTMRRFLGLTAHGALDEVVLASGREVPAWCALLDAIDGRLPLDALDAALDPLPTARRLAIVSEALAGDYELWSGHQEWSFLPSDRLAEGTELKRAGSERVLETLAHVVARCGDEGVAWAAGEPWRGRHYAMGLDLALAVAREDRAMPDLEARVRATIALPPISRRTRIVDRALALLPPDCAAEVVASTGWKR